MGQFPIKMSRKKCPVCGKEAIARSSRDKIAFCSRICADEYKRRKKYYGMRSEADKSFPS